MKPSTPSTLRSRTATEDRKTELSPSTQLRKAVFAGALWIMAGCILMNGVMADAAPPTPTEAASRLKQRASTSVPRLIYAGIELDGMRSPFFFKVNEGVKNAPLMTELIGQIRGDLDPARAKGRSRYLLRVNVPRTPELALECGLDVAAWNRDGLVDGISPGCYNNDFSAMGGLALAAETWPSSSAADSPNQSKWLLSKLKKASLHGKAELLQEIYENAAFHPSGIMYSMMRLDADGLRPFVAADFVGKIGLDASVGKLKLDGPWDYLHGENSITASGLYLAAQTFRYEATHSKKALEQARQAFRSLDLIYRMGEEAGKPGWMGKPYGFRPSGQTSADQYLDACWGLWTYHRIASADDRRRIEQMFVSFADYWRRADYTLSYFGSHWDQKGDTGSYNAIFAMINACAYSFSRSPVHLQEFEKWMAIATWPKTTLLETLRANALRQFKEKGKAEVVPYSVAYPLAKDVLKPGECLCWETIIHAKFVVVAADLIVQSKTSDLSGQLANIVERWWGEWKYGMDDDFLAYYWFAVDLLNDSWRPLPSTKPLPKEQWLFGNPFMSSLSQVRWNEPLARFMVSSVIAAEHCPSNRKQIQSIGRRMLESLDEVHLHWLVDLDGKQLPPEISYYGQCLSSEVPGSFLSAYWKGRRDGLW